MPIFACIRVLRRAKKDKTGNFPVQDRCREVIPDETTYWKQWTIFRLEGEESGGGLNRHWNCRKRGLGVRFYALYSRNPGFV
jgi:hypothetical protein